MRNKPQRQKEVNTVKERFYVICVLADIRRKELLVPKNVMKRVHILSSGEAQLFYTYRNRYPDFKVVVV